LPSVVNGDLLFGEQARFSRSCNNSNSISVVRHGDPSIPAIKKVAQKMVVIAAVGAAVSKVIVSGNVLFPRATLETALFVPLVTCTLPH
jgi:hypothetical protein